MTNANANDNINFRLQELNHKEKLHKNLIGFLKTFRQEWLHPHVFCTRGWLDDNILNRWS